MAQLNYDCTNNRGTTLTRPEAIITKKDNTAASVAVRTEDRIVGALSQVTFTFNPGPQLSPTQGRLSITAPNWYEGSNPPEQAFNHENFKCSSDQFEINHPGIVRDNVYWYTYNSPANLAVNQVVLVCQNWRNPITKV